MLLVVILVSICMVERYQMLARTIRNHISDTTPNISSNIHRMHLLPLLHMFLLPETISLRMKSTSHLPPPHYHHHTPPSRLLLLLSINSNSGSRDAMREEDRV